MGPARTLEEAAPAKINLALHVLGRRDDGMHELDGLVVFAALGDALTGRVGTSDTVSIKGPFAGDLAKGLAEGLAGDEANLVVQARNAFRNAHPEAALEAISLELTKNLPVAAGIGGGSADAAACLRLMGRLARPARNKGQLVALASGLGADVPMCLSSRPAHICGVGERVRLLAGFPPLFAVLVNPGVSLSTAEVFGRLDRRTNPGLPERPARFSGAVDLVGWLAGTRNDLEAPAMAMAPVIGELKSAVAAIDGCLFARMSGSGATVFGLFGTAGGARLAAEQLAIDWPGCWVADTAIGN